MPELPSYVALESESTLALDSTPGMGVQALQSRLPASGLFSRKGGLGLTFWICLGWVVFMILLAVLASVLPIKAPNFQDYSAVNVGPTARHLLGTDDLGRDLLSRVIFGSRVSLVIGFAPILAGLVIGGAAGLLAGYRSGPADTVLNAVSFVLLAFPALLAIMVIETFWKPVSLFKLTVMFTFVAAPSCSASYGPRRCRSPVGNSWWRHVPPVPRRRVCSCASSFPTSCRRRSRSR